MDLLSVTSGVIGAVNPFVAGTIQQSTGYVTGSDGTQTPQYTAPIAVQVQVQPLQYQDLMKMSGLNISGIRRKIYLEGDWEGLVRDEEKGGDLITISTDPEGQVWLVVFVFEHWPGWTAACITLQNNS